jgi:HPt (histidine-containing phosphotransfer) domain-containing protein
MDSKESISCYLKDEFELDVDDIKDMLNEFVLNLNRIINDLETHLDSNSLEEIRRTAHSLKGCSANIGATYLADVALKIEQLAKADEMSNEIYNSHIESIKDNLSIIEKQ